MERVDERAVLAQKAVASLAEVMELTTPSAIERDASIKRFELSFEATWKAAKAVLLEREGLEAASPKGVIRACREVGWLNDEQASQALLMADDRNLAVHTYNEQLARDIYNRLSEHLKVLELWVTAISKP